MNPSPDPYAPSPKRIVCALSAQPVESAALRISEVDDHMARRVTAMAADLGAEVCFVHVVDWLDGRVVEGGESVLNAVVEQLDPMIDELAEEAAAVNVQTSRVYAMGRPWYEILRVAHEREAQLVAISPRRETLTFADRLVHGSTAWRLLRKAQPSVLVVDPRADRLPSRIMALIDRSPVSARVVETSNALAEALGAEKVAVHCLDFPDDIVLHRLPNAHQAILRYHRQERDSARSELEALTGGHAAGWSVDIDEGWVVRRCPRLAKEHGADLVVMGGASPPSLAGVLLGTTAERLLEVFHISAWVVRPEDWRSPVVFSPESDERPAGR